MREVLEQISSKVKSEDLTQHLHDVSIHVNQFQSFGAVASKMAGAYKKPQYTLNSVEAFYLQVQKNGAQASLLDMAEMFAMKYQKDGHLKKEKSITESSG
jgi:oligoribonuclease NrnB/cAMP/cGMP phosphodiesterase (DHH superfamily)